MIDTCIAESAVDTHGNSALSAAALSPINLLFPHIDNLNDRYVKLC